MKRLLLTMACATLMIGARAEASTIVLNFDGFPDDTILNVGHFDPVGIHFDQRLQINDGDIADLPSSVPNTAVNIDTFGGNITGSFVGPLLGGVSSISVFVGDAGGDLDTVTLNGYNALNILVDSASFAGLSAQTLSIAGSGIVRFEILQTGLVAIDDFTVTAPEPGTMALMGLGLAAAIRNRRRARQ